MTTSRESSSNSKGSGTNRSPESSPGSNLRILHRIHASLFSPNSNSSMNPTMSPSPSSSPHISTTASTKWQHQHQDSSPRKSPRSTKARQLSDDLRTQHVHASLGLQVTELIDLFRGLIPQYYSGSIIRDSRDRREGVAGDDDEDDDDYDDYNEEEESTYMLLERCQYHVSNILAGVGAYSSALPKHWPREDLEDMANILQTFLDYYGELTTSSSSSSSLQPIRPMSKGSRPFYSSSLSSSSPAAVANLPPCLLARVHTTLGLLRQAIWGPKCAIGNLEKALWIRTKTTPPPRKTGSNVACFAPHEVGMASHRLALAYGAAGQKDEARSLLYAALENYERASTSTTANTFGLQPLQQQQPPQIPNFGGIVVGTGINMTNLRGMLQPFIQVAKDDLEKFQRRRHYHHNGKGMSLLLAKHQKDWSSLPTLPILRIDEDDPLEQQQQHQQQQHRRNRVRFLDSGEEMDDPSSSLMMHSAAL